MVMGMKQDQAEAETVEYMLRHVDELQALVRGSAINVVKFFDGTMTVDELYIKLWNMVADALREHYGNSGKLFVVVKSRSLVVEVHGDDDFDDLTKGPHLTIYNMLGTTKPPVGKVPEQTVKEGGPIGHQ